MPDWFVGVLIVGAIFSLPFVWGSLSERSKAAAAVGSAAEAAVDGGRWFFMKAAGILAVAGGIYLLTRPDGFQEFALALVVSLYGAYLVFPGRPDDKMLWFW